jgi:hypothetical protein
MDNLIDFEPVHERICKTGVKVKYKNLTLISIHAPTEEKDEVAKEGFYSSLEKVCDAVPNYKLKTVLEDLNTKGGEKRPFIPSICRAQPSQQNK